MKNRFFILNILLLSVAFTISLKGQETDRNPIVTGAPILSIGSDARIGGMGDAGIASVPDVYSQQWNLSKYAFIESKGGVGFTYTPWLDKVADDMALMNLVGFYKLGDGNQAISASLKYFKIGDMGTIYSDDFSSHYGAGSPYEMSFDFGYSRKLSDSFSLGVALRYTRIDYTTLDDEIDASNIISADIGVYHERYINIGDHETLLSIAGNISNLTGSKVKLSSNGYSSFIPTNLGVGASILYPLADKSSFTFSLDLNKLLVPTPPVMKKDESVDDYSRRLDDYSNTSAFKGVFKSFSDAPGGFSEEMKEIMISTGAEFNFKKLVMLRAGYSYQNKYKGNKSYFTFGAGVCYKMFQLDASYLLGSGSKNPLDQTLRLSLAFNLPTM